MAEYQTVVGGFLNEPLTGRRPIETPETEINQTNVLKVVMGKAEPIHLLNKNEIRFLHNYYLGSQPVLHRTKEYHAEITNRIVENHANECVGFYTGYMSGTPCSYVRSETATGDGEEIARLSNALQYEGKDALDRRLWQWMLECGQGYRIVLPDKGYNGNYPDETPLLVDVPDPDMAYVIYNSGIGHKPIANVLHIPRNYQNDLNDLICVYTPNQYFEIDNGKVTKSENHSLGMLPMVEYKLNPERMGLFEPAIPVLDAINLLESNRLDGVEQFIQSIMLDIQMNGNFLEGAIASLAQVIHNMGVFIGWIIKGVDESDRLAIAANGNFAEKFVLLIADVINGIKDAVTWFGKLIDKVSKFNPLSVGKNIIDGITKGITGNTNVSNDATKQLTDEIKKTAQDELDIHSPSKWFEGIGSYVVQGLANGITGSLGYVNDAMNKLVDATKLKGEEMANYGIDCGTSYVNGIISGLDSKWAELDNNLKTDFFGTAQTFIQAAQSGDWKTVGTTIAAGIWGAMGDEQRKRVKSVASDLLGRLSKELKSQASSLLNTAATIGKNLVNGLTQNFGTATQNTAKMVENITSVFTKSKTPLSTAALAISKGLSGGLLSQFPKMLAGVAGLITTIGGAFTAMLEAIGGTLSVLGIPTGFAMVAGGVAIAAAIAGIISSINRSNYSDSSQYVGTSSYDSTYGSGSYSGTYSAASGNSEEMRDAVYNGCYNAFLDIWQRYGEELLKEQNVNVYLDGKQIAASVDKVKKDRGVSIMGTEVYSY